MKKLLFILITFLIPYFVRAQVQLNNNINSESQSATLKLFPTTNIWNFIKLDTRNGQMWQVQWSTGDDRFISNLSLIPLVTKENEKDGRFTLHTTQNINTFLLLDQIDGRVWQVQWSVDSKKRGIIAIY